MVIAPCKGICSWSPECLQNVWKWPGVGWRVCRQGSKPRSASALCRSAQCCTHRMRRSRTCLIATISSQRTSSLNGRPPKAKNRHLPCPQTQQCKAKRSGRHVVIGRVIWCSCQVANPCKIHTQIQSYYRQILALWTKGDFGRHGIHNLYSNTTCRGVWGVLKPWVSLSFTIKFDERY